MVIESVCWSRWLTTNKWELLQQQPTTVRSKPVSPWLMWYLIIPGFPGLVGGWATPLKNMKVNWDDYSQYMGKCQKWQPNHQPADFFINASWVISGSFPVATFCHPRTAKVRDVVWILFQRYRKTRGYQAMKTWRVNVERLKHKI